jgi:hypothetical protein
VRLLVPKAALEAHGEAFTRLIDVVARPILRAKTAGEALERVEKLRPYADKMAESSFSLSQPYAPAALESEFSAVFS